jgi:hypothetical protein
MLLVRRFAFLTAGCGEDGRANNHRTVARSLRGGSPSSRFGPACTTCEAWPPCHRMGTRCTSGETLPVTLWGTSGKSAFKKEFIPRAVATPCFSCTHRTLLPSVPVDGACRCSLEGSASGPPPSGLTAEELVLFVSCVVVLSILFSSCCYWRSATSWGLALFCHRSASRIFIMQPGCNLPLVVIYKDDHQPRGGEKRVGLRPPPCPQLQGCSSSSLGWKASRVGVLPSAWASDPLLPPAFGGEGCSPALRRRRTSATQGRPAAGAVSCHVSGSLAWMALAPPPAPPAAAKRGATVRPPHGRRSRHA